MTTGTIILILSFSIFMIVVSFGIGILLIVGVVVLANFGL